MKINLQQSFFAETKQELLCYGSFKIDAFKYASGVEALEVKNNKCSFIFTPFKGQQVWHYTVDGKELSMKTTIKEPTKSNVYLENYGGFIYHCGLISMGVPDGNHPQHGEIPNAQYDSAYIACGCDEGGRYICLGGELNHDTAFIRKYTFAPEIKLYEDSALLKINVRIENKRAYDMEYMYLCHINFLPIDKAQLICSAKCDNEHIKPYNNGGSDALMRYIEQIERDPAVMTMVGAKGQCYDPEICCRVKYVPDEQGRAYTMQYTDSGACFVSHPTDPLSNGVRWISRTQNEDAMGMVLPATAEHIGYEHAKKTGQLKVLGPNEVLEFYMEAGFIEKDEADKYKAKIEKIIG